MDNFYKVDDIQKILNVSTTKAYKIIQQLNKELKEKGYITIAGRIPIKYFKEKYYCWKEGVKDVWNYKHKRL